MRGSASLHVYDYTPSPPTPTPPQSMASDMLVSVACFCFLRGTVDGRSLGRRSADKGGRSSADYLVQLRKAKPIIVYPLPPPLSDRWQISAPFVYLYDVFFHPKLSMTHSRQCRLCKEACRILYRKNSFLCVRRMVSTLWEGVFDSTPNPIPRAELYWKLSEINQARKYFRKKCTP